MSHEIQEDNSLEGNDQQDNDQQENKDQSQLSQLDRERAENLPAFNASVKVLEQQQQQTQDPQKKYQANPIDLCSIFVNNLDENTTDDDIREYFQDCGKIEKITLRNDKITGLLYSYIQFAEQISVDDAVLLSDGMIRGRKIKVFKKRTNLRPIRGGHRNRGMSMGGTQYKGMYAYPNVFRGGRGGYRGRGGYQQFNK